MFLSQRVTKTFIQRVVVPSSSLPPHSNSSLLSTPVPPSPGRELYFLRLPYKVQPTEWFHMTESYCVTVLEAEVQNPGFGRAVPPLNPFLLLQASGGLSVPWFVDASPLSLPSSSHGAFPVPLFTRPSSHRTPARLGTHPTPA